MVNKNIKSLFVLTAFAVLVGCAKDEQSTQTPPLYLNESASIDERVNDLVTRLTLEEKVAQLFDKSPAIERLNESEFTEIVVTDSIPVNEAALKNIKVLSLAPMLARVIRNVHEGKSVSEAL